MADDIDADVLAADLARLGRDMDDTSASAGGLGTRFGALEGSLTRVTRAVDSLVKAAAGLTAPATGGGAAGGNDPSAAVGRIGDAFGNLRGTETPVVALANGLAGLTDQATSAVAQVPGVTAAIGSLTDGWTLFNAAAESSTVKSINSFKENKKAIGDALGAVGEVSGLTNVLKKLGNTTPVVAAGVGLLEGRQRAIALATKAWTGAQAALNLVMEDNPIVLAVTAIVALAAGFYVAYTRIGWFHNAVNAVFSWVRAHWPLLVSILGGPLVTVVLLIVRHFNTIVSAVRSLPGRIGAIARTIWTGFRSAASSAVSAVANRLRDLLAFFGRMPASVGRAAKAIWSGFKSIADGAVHWVADRLRDLVSMISRIPSQLAGLAGHIPGFNLIKKAAGAVGIGGGGGGGGGKTTGPASGKGARTASLSHGMTMYGIGGAAPVAYSASAGPQDVPSPAPSALIQRGMVAPVTHTVRLAPVNIHLDRQVLASAMLSTVEDWEAAL